ncbi:MAG: hypothetical protein WBL07_01305 [Thiothrix litoralis]|uniref:hypothetical protein n=1 Tax=Thiothrix litoralis TaxID=2891210 RepID=UPI003C772772
MKYFFPFMMVLVILSGLSLIVTPYIGEYIFPASKTTLRAADPEHAKQALADWFNTSPASLSDVQAIKQVSAQVNNSWFTFKADAPPVKNFILQNRLKQQDLTPETLQKVFMAQTPAIPWWQPAALERQTCFIGTDEGQEIGLIYHAELRTGFIVIRTRTKPAKF